MTNRQRIDKSKAVIIAAVVTSLVIMLGGLAFGLSLAVRDHRESGDSGRLMAGYLLQDSAYELRRTMSALRLCNEVEPAEELSRTGLVHAVRAETALECHTDDWADSRNKEAFLNDIATVLHTYSAQKTIELSDKLYEYSAEFYRAVTENTEFVYNGELIEGEQKHPDVEITDGDIDAAKRLVSEALDTEKAQYVGAWDGHIEFNIERDGKSGYAVVCGDKIIEFAYSRGNDSQPSDKQTAQEVAVKTAERCGYDNLTVKWCEVTGSSTSVLMCKSYDGALACDDYATAVVVNDSVVAFSAGGCDGEHKDIPSAKKTEAQARRAVKDAPEGTLVVRKKDGKERICYEYRLKLEDGVHYVYVCAESGKQIEVK